MNIFIKEIVGRMQYGSFASIVMKPIVNMKIELCIL